MVMVVAQRYTFSSCDVHAHCLVHRPAHARSILAYDLCSSTALIVFQLCFAGPANLQVRAFRESQRLRQEYIE
jgi:hypothetical protein